jgi:Uncharacterised protein family (UPF0158)
MQTLKVNLGDMVMAFDNSSYEMTWYLNTETGEVFFVTDEARENLHDLLTGEATLDEVRAVIEAQGLPEYEQIELMQAAMVDDLFGEGYISIPSQDSRTGYQDMEAFIETVTDEHLQEKLAIAIEGKGAFRRFKDVLERYPQERERWFIFRDQRQRQRIAEWLEDQGIQAELI